MIHERLRGVEDIVDWLFFRRWYVAEHDLKHTAEDLIQAHAGTIEEVNHALIDLTAVELNITTAALLERQPDRSFQRVHATASWPDRFLRVIPSDDPLLALAKDAPRLSRRRLLGRPSAVDIAHLPPRPRGTGDDPGNAEPNRALRPPHQR